MISTKNLTVSLVGSNGRMGQMLTRLLAAKVKTVHPIDLRPGLRTLHDDDLKESIPASDMVLLAVPASNLETVLKSVCRFMRYDALLTDITSVKMLPMKLMEKYHNGPVVGTHPLFGPSIGPVSNQTATPPPGATSADSTNAQGSPTTPASMPENSADNSPSNSTGNATIPGNATEQATPAAPEGDLPSHNSAEPAPSAAAKNQQQITITTIRDPDFVPETGLENRFEQRKMTKLNQQALQGESDDEFEVKNVAIVRGINAQDKDVELIKTLIFSTGYYAFETTAKEHDQAIAVIQALNFLSNLAYFTTASKLPNLDKYVTPSFKRRLRSAQKMLVEDAELFTGIARNIPQLHTAVKEYVEALQNAASLDQSSIDRMLKMARKYYNQHAED